MNSRSQQGVSGKIVPSSSQKGYILFSLLIVGTLIMCVAMASMVGVRNSLKVAGVQRQHGNAFNIAEAGKECALADLRGNAVTLSPGTTSWIYFEKSFDAGKYSVRCITNSLLDTLWLQSYATVGAQSATVEVACYRHPFSSTMSFSFPAAIISKADVHLTGSIIVDGNDYDSAVADSIVGKGVYGVSTGGIYDPQNPKKDYAYGRGYTSDSSVIPLDSVVAASVDISGYPKTPEEVLGMSAGSLDAYKTSSMPAVPFHGIVYITSGPGEIKDPPLDDCSGIFIYHDASYQSVLRNIHAKNFKGIIICDQIDKINGGAAILGAVVTLSNDPAGHTFGNGNATIRYSSRILANLGQYIWSSSFFVDVLSWKEK